MKTLIDLALKDEFSEKVGGTFKGALASAFKEMQEQKTKAAATDLIQLLGRVETTKQNHRDILRRLRGEEKRSKEALESIDRALAYGQESENFIPLMELLGYSCHLESDVREKFSKIPENFKTKR